VSDEDPTRLGGRSIILTLYVISVAIAGMMGGIIGSIGLRDLRAVSYLGVVIFEPTPVGLAAFGMTTVGAVFGAFLLLTIFVSKRYTTG
jgi:hypothetical protein